MALDCLAEPDPGIEAIGDDVDQPIVHHDLERERGVLGAQDTSEGTAMCGTVTRNVPPASSPSRAAASASTAVRSAGAAALASRAPLSVNRTLRVVRTSSGVPSSSSSARTAWLTAERETPSATAAAEKLRRSATSTNVARLESITYQHV